MQIQALAFPSYCQNTLFMPCTSIVCLDFFFLLHIFPLVPRSLDVFFLFLLVHLHVINISGLNGARRACSTSLVRLPLPIAAVHG
ncbi:hypothetical protein BC940DRAFT_289375 [Gongronella butleri]|nr:hypothetical protein BC940DRAFT_289375 [Gongronella butleri]